MFSNFLLIDKWSNFTSWLRSFECEDILLGLVIKFSQESISDGVFSKTMLARTWCPGVTVCHNLQPNQTIPECWDLDAKFYCFFSLIMKSSENMSDNGFSIIAWICIFWMQHTTLLVFWCYGGKTRFLSLVKVSPWNICLPFFLEEYIVVPN